jgi:hypothetical protein
MATKAKTKIEYTSVKIGEYKVKVKGTEKTKIVVAQMDKRVVKQLGLTGVDGGIPVTRTIKKGASAGAKYTSYRQGSKGRGYGLCFNSLEIGAKAADQKSRNIATTIIKIPCPTGTPLSVIAAFADQKLKGKGKPQRIITPTGSSYYLNTSKTSQGK